MGIKGLKLEKKSIFWPLEDEQNVQIHILVKFNGATTTTEGYNRFLPKNGKKRIKNVGLKGLKFTNLR